MVKKKVLLLIPSLDFGGAQRSFSKLSLAYAREHFVYIGVFNTYDGIAYPYGGTLLDMNISGAGSTLGKIINFIKRVNCVKKIKKKYKIDVCISFLEGADYVNLLSKQQEKTIISIRGSKVSDGEIRGWVGRLRKKVFIPWLYKYADKIITVSEGLKNEMVNDFGLRSAKIRTIYNFYELEKIEEEAGVELPEAFKQIYRYPVLVNSGRLHVQKNQASLLRIFARMKQSTPVKLVILGDGPLREELVALSQSLGLKTYAVWSGLKPDGSDQVYFLGYQENPFKYIKRATIFTFTSSWEGFPNALAESMACQIPVVSTDCPTGPREILAPGTSLEKSLKDAEYAPFGLLLPVCIDEQMQQAETTWADHLNKLLEAPVLLKEYREKAYNRVHDFAKSKVMKDWMEEVNA